MSTCYEHLRKKRNPIKDAEVFVRLENYFRSLENNTLDEYHNKRGRKK